MTGPGEAGPRVWAVVGATGTGKTALSLDLAEALAARARTAEIVNADAMQLYRGMDIGTAKLPVAQRRGIPHHVIDVLDVTEEATAAAYQDAARAAVAQIHARGRDAIVVGGSGLYVSSVLFDFRFPPRDEARRMRLERELSQLGPEVLYARLRDLDPVTAARVDPRNARRIVRALEVREQGAADHRAALPEAPVLWRPHTAIVGVQVPRDTLVRRLDARVEAMWRDGLLEEVETLRASGLERGVTASRAIGYAQALAQLSGALNRRDAVAQTQALTRRYARRQVSWFRRYPGVRWLDPGTDAAELADSSQ